MADIKWNGSGNGGGGGAKKNSSELTPNRYEDQDMFKKEKCCQI